jgi:hypothetical protein
VSRDAIDDRDDMIAVRDGETSSWKETILDIDNNEHAFVIG